MSCHAFTCGRRRRVLLAAVAALVLTAGCATRGAPPVAVWAFDDADNLGLDSSLNGHDAVPRGGVIYAEVDGRRVALFDGSGYLTVPGEAAFDLDTFTIVSVFRLDALDVNHTIIGKGATDAARLDQTFFVFPTLQNLIHAGFESPGVDQGCSLKTAPGLLQKGVWYTLRLSFDGETLALTLKDAATGEVLAVKSASMPYPTGKNDLEPIIGAWTGRGGLKYYLIGAIDRLAVYGGPGSSPR